MRLILHVGLPKTATTTIQHVLDTAKPQLAAQGVLYPGTTQSQMELVSRSQFKQPAGDGGPGSLAETMGRVVDEVRAVRPKHVVLSCERMVLVSPGTVGRMQRAIATWLPEVEETKVLAYVRDPVAWATSLCQQRLKMGTTRVAEFAADPWPLSLEGMLAKYVSRYGLTAVTVRHLHPEHLVHGRVVDDFMAAIGLAGFAVPGEDVTLNKALTLHGAQVADVLADLLPRGRRGGSRKRLIRQLLQAVEGPRFVLPREVQARIVTASRRDVDYIGTNWGLDIRPVLIDPPEDEGLEEEAVLARALDIVETLERLEEQGQDAGDGT